MSKFTDTASEKLLIVAGKISNEKHMASIKNAFYTLMPVILTGAFCTLITNVVCSTTTNGISLAKVPGMAWLRSSSASVHFFEERQKRSSFFETHRPKKELPQMAWLTLFNEQAAPFSGPQGPPALPQPGYARSLTPLASRIPGMMEHRDPATMRTMPAPILKEMVSPWSHRARRGDRAGLKK